VTERLDVPSSIPAPPYVTQGMPPAMENKPIQIKNEAEIKAMRRTGRFTSYIREFAGKQVAVGISTDEIDKRVHAECLRHNRYPSPLGYMGFPKSVCTSLNQVV
jgi:methionyl aminopeptidase